VVTFPTWKETFGERPSEDEIVTELSKLNRLHTVWLLARLNIHLGIDRFHANSSETIKLQRVLITDYMDDEVLAKLKEKYGRERLDERFAFHSQQVLLVLKMAFQKADRDGGVRPDDDTDARYRLGRCLLMTNDLLLTRQSARAIRRERESQKRRYIALQLQLGPGLDINNPPDIRNSAVRSDIMFGKLLTRIAASLDVAEIFRKYSGISLQTYLDFIFGLLAHYISRGNDELIADPGLACVNLRSFFAEAPKEETENFWRLECKSLEEVSTEIGKSSNLMPQHDFIAFRKAPFVKVSDDDAVPLHLGFIQEKLESGLFWTVFNCLTTDQERDRLFHTWGLLFEQYAARLLDHAFAGKEEKFVPFPKFADSGDESFDGIVIRGQYWFVMEFKGGFLKAPAKYAEDESEFLRDLELKFATGSGAGLSQLAKKIGEVFASKESQCRRIEGLDSSGVRVVVPLLIVQDSFVSSEITAIYLIDRFRYLLRQQKLERT